MSQPYKVCPRCQTPANLDAGECLSCGRQYNTRFAAPQQQTQAFIPPQTFQQPYAPLLDQAGNTAYGTIITMWVMTVFGNLIKLTHFPLGTLIDVFSIALAIYLYTTGNRANKINASVKLTFAIIGWLFTFWVMANPTAYHGY